MKVLVFVFCCLALCAASGAVPVPAAPSAPSAATPGMQFSVTQSGVDEFAAILLAVINAELQDIAIPDVQTSTSVPVVGKVDVSLTDIKLSSFRLGSLGGDFALPSSLVADVSGVDFTVNLNWKWRQSSWPHISSSGSAVVTPVNGAASVSVAISAVGGRPHTAVTTDSVSFQDFNVSIHGSWLSWLYDLLIDLFKGSIKSTVSSAVSSAIQSAVDSSLNAEFGKLPLTGYVGSGKARANVDFSVVSTMVASYSEPSGSSFTFLAVGDSFAVTDNATGTACPLVPPPFPSVLPSPAQSMLQLLVADQFVNCLAWVSCYNGLLNVTLTDADIPPFSPIRLNTSDWALLVPQLYAQYPDQLMVLDIQPLVAPAIATAAGAPGPTAAGGFSLRNSVVDKDGSLTYAFTLGLNLTAALNVTVSNAQPPATNGTLLFGVTALNAALDVLDSAIGTIDLAPLDSLATVIGLIARNIVNSMLANGFPLPISPGFQFADPQVAFYDGFIAVGSNFTYVA